MTTPTVDAHTHLHLLEDTGAGVARALAAGVDGMFTIGTSPDSIRTSITIAETYPDNVRVGAALHPNSCGGVNDALLAEIAELARHPLVTAIAETGFDTYHDRATVDEQMMSFRFHVELAKELQLPLVIHTREADQITLDALEKYCGNLTVVMHCFSMPQRVDEVIERGYMCSFAGNVTYKSADDLRQASARVPDELLMAETDAPYLTPVPHRGSKNEPAYVRHTVDVLAAARGIDADACAALVAANARRTFSLPMSVQTTIAGG